MDTADLKVFEAVARTGGMNRAAAALHTVQSNVTARIQALEAELGCPLFDRHSRGVALTPRRPAAAALCAPRRLAADRRRPRGA